ncbi:MAG: ArsR/SmtB family transcription factor [Candidatus Dormibacteria bacterium]
MILKLVLHTEMTAGAIASHFDLTRPAISQHLTVLKGAGLVTERREGTRRLYRARPEGLEELRSSLEEFWDRRLDRLREAAEHAEARSHDR